MVTRTVGQPARREQRPELGRRPRAKGDRMIARGLAADVTIQDVGQRDVGRCEADRPAHADGQRVRPAARTRRISRDRGDRIGEELERLLADHGVEAGVGEGQARRHCPAAIRCAGRWSPQADAGHAQHVVVEVEADDLARSAPTRAAACRATTPVPHATSSTRCPLADARPARPGAGPRARRRAPGIARRRRRRRRRPAIPPPPGRDARLDMTPPPCRAEGAV